MAEDIPWSQAVCQFAGRNGGIGGMYAYPEGCPEPFIQFISQFYDTFQIIQRLVIRHNAFGETDFKPQDVVPVFVNHPLHPGKVDEFRVKILTELKIQLPSGICGQKTLNPYCGLGDYGFIK